MTDTESREKDWEQELQSEENDVDNLEAADGEEETVIEDTDELAEDVEDEDCLDVRLRHLQKKMWRQRVKRRDFLRRGKRKINRKKRSQS